MSRYVTCEGYRRDPKLWLAVGHTMYGPSSTRCRTPHLHARRALWELFRQTQAMRTRPPQPPRIFFDL